MVNRYFKLPALSKQKFHFTIGHSTVVGSVLFFAPPLGTAPAAFGAEHLYLFPLNPTPTAPNPDTFPRRLVEDAVQYAQAAKGGSAAAGVATLSLDEVPPQPTLWVLVDLERPVFCPEHSICVASKLEVRAPFEDP